MPIRDDFVDAAHHYIRARLLAPNNGVAAVHRDGMWWHKTVVPPREHACQVHTVGYSADFGFVYRCACGALNDPDAHGWIERNARIDEEQRRPAQEAELTPLETASEDMCAIHDQREPSLPGDYKTCGECGHVWRTEADFVRTVLTNYEAHITATLLYAGTQLGPYRGDPREQPYCPACTHSF